MSDPQHDEGMATRRAVLGDAHVDAAVARTTEFTAIADEVLREGAVQ